MKTLLFVLIAGMVFLVTPISASAERWSHTSRYKYDQGEIQRDRHHAGRRHKHHNRHYNHGYNQQYNHRSNRDLRWELRETRHQLSRVKRQRRHHHRYTYYRHQPVLVIGVPPLVFLFDW